MNTLASPQIYGPIRPLPGDNPFRHMPRTFAAIVAVTLLKVVTFFLSLADRLIDGPEPVLD